MNSGQWPVGYMLFDVLELYTFIAKLSPSSSSSWAELALISISLTHPHLPPGIVAKLEI